MRIFVTFRDTNSWINTVIFPLIYIKDWQSKAALHWCARQIMVIARQNLFHPVPARRYDRSGPNEPENSPGPGMQGALHSTSDAFSQAASRQVIYFPSFYTHR